MENFKTLASQNENYTYKHVVSIQGQLNCKPDEIIPLIENRVYSDDGITKCMTYLRAIPDTDHIGASAYILDIAMLNMDEQNESLVSHARRVFIQLLEEGVPTLPYDYYLSQETLANFLQGQEESENIKFILTFITELFHKRQFQIKSTSYSPDFIISLFQLAEANQMNEVIPAICSSFGENDQETFEEILPYLFEWIQRMLDSDFYPNGYLALSVLILPQIIRRSDIPQFNFDKFAANAAQLGKYNALLMMSKYEPIPILVPPDVVHLALNRQYKVDENDDPNTNFLQALFMCLAKFNQLSDDLKQETVEVTLQAFETEKLQSILLIIGNMFGLPVDVYIEYPDLIFNLIHYIEEESVSTEIMKNISFVALRAAELGKGDFVLALGQALSPEFDFLEECSECQDEKKANVASILYNIFHSVQEEE